MRKEGLVTPSLSSALFSRLLAKDAKLSEILNKYMYKLNY